MKKIILAILVLALAIPSLVLADKPDKVTICHASGLAGTTKYETLEISWNAVYGANGNAGHFEENGTPRAGHEQDYFGACLTEATPTPTPTSTATATPTPTPTESATPTPSASESQSATPTPSPQIPSPTPSESVMPSPSVSPSALPTPVTVVTGGGATETTVPDTSIR